MYRPAASLIREALPNWADSTTVIGVSSSSSIINSTSSGSLVPRPEKNLMPLSLCGLCERSEEHTSELQSREKLVCRLLLEKKKLYFDSRVALLVRKCAMERSVGGV